MLPLVEFPQIVQQYAPWFETVFSAESLVQFQRYSSGLIISENKTVDGIIGITYKGEKETYYSYCRTHRIHNFGKQCLVVNFNQPDLSDSPSFYNSNRLVWRSVGITRIRRHRWPVEVYHEEGKAEGLDKYQVRDFRAISRHIGLVAVTYSLLRATPHDEALLHKLQRIRNIRVDSRWISKAAHRSGVGPPKHRACGLWLASSVQD